MVHALHFLRLACFLFLFGFSGFAEAAEEDVEREAAGLMTPEAERAAERGLTWLAARQHDDGGFGDGQLRGNAGVCALAGMAFLASGSTPGRGPRGACVDRCLDYLLAHCRPSGFIAGPDASHGPMYGHGFAVMFLAECRGMSHRGDLREKLADAVRIIVQCQNEEGGWRYQPVRAAAADVSVTACQMMALRAARNAGLHVPSETIDRAVGYVQRSRNGDGGFAYMLQGEKTSAFPRSAAALTALYGAGMHQGEEIERGLDYLSQFQPGEGSQQSEAYYYYGQYYAVQAMWQAGGERWCRWYPAARDALIARQEADGSWRAPEGNEYATAMACMVLLMPRNALPIFQR